MIRNATEKDLKALRDLAAELGYDRSEAAVAESLSEVLKEPEHILLVAEENQQVVGFIEGEPYHELLTPASIRVLALIVTKDFEDQGIGGQLLEALEARTQELGYGLVHLGSGAPRKLAHEFYEKHGYVADHLQMKYVKTL